MASASVHPIRLVVTDEQHRSRLTVFFRLFLAIPHFLWAGLLGTAVFVIVFISWWAALFTGRTPEGLRGFLAGYLRYVTHVEGYLFLAANPFPPFYLGSAARYPVDLEIDPQQPQHRLVTLFRLFLALPALLISTALTGGPGSFSSGYYRAGLGVAGLAAFLMWFVSLVRGRAPRGLRDLAAWGIGYSAQLGGYLMLLTDRYPTSDPLVHLVTVPAGPAPGEQPAQGIVTDDLRRSRLTVFFRLLLWIPHLVWYLLWSALAFVTAIAGWFAALALGRMPRPVARFLSAYVRYTVHMSAFVYLAGNPFPGFAGRPGSYPIDLELDPFGRQRRSTIVFRLFLSLPALLMANSAAGVASLAALLGWFVSLARGRMPEGLRNVGAWAVAYSGQTWAYLLVLTDRYPYSSPTAVRWGEPRRRAAQDDDAATLNPPPGAFV